MTELIDKQASMKAICGGCFKSRAVDIELKCRGTCNVIDILHQQPTIAAEPVKHAYWESWGYFFHGIEWKRCSACNKCAGVSYYGLLDGKIEMETPAVCGCCGARMDGGAENG